MSISNAPVYRDFGGEKLAIQISSAFNAQKHLESNSFAAIAGPSNVWLGIMRYHEMYESNYQPLLSMDEMVKNTVYLEADTTTFTYGVPYKLGCPFIMEVLCDHNKLGYDRSQFHVIISEHLYTYHDILITDRRNAVGLRVVDRASGGLDAEIIPMNGGYRFLLEMASGISSDYIERSDLKTGTEIERVDNDGEDEFSSKSTAYTGNLLSAGSNRMGMDLYQYTVGNSELSLSYTITSAASWKDLKINSTLPQLNGLPKEASTDIINFYSKEDVSGSKNGRVSLSGVSMWAPRFMMNLGKDLKDLQAMQLMYAPGSQRSNGREIITKGAGFYHQVKLKGNHFYYSTASQAFDLVKEMLSNMYAGKHHIPYEDRVMEIELGDGVYEMIQPFFQQYFKSHNNIIFTGDHPAYKDVLTRDKNGDLLYKPAKFGAVFYDNFGWIKLKRNSALSNLDAYKKNQNYIMGKPESAYMIFVKDLSEGNFTGVQKTSGIDTKNANNIMYLKQKGVSDSMEFTIGQGNINPALLSAIGADPRGHHSRDTSFKGVRVTLRTHGEVFVQDASRMMIAEFDPSGIKEARQTGIAAAPLF